mgnify:CR=1 FL=1
MDLEQKYKEETGFCVGKIHEIGTTYYSDDYVNWLEQQLRLYSVVVPKGAFNCGKERAFGEERCKAQCKDCVIEYQDN